MGDVKRYNPDKLGGAGQMLQRHNGKWISYDDYAALEAQLARVKAEADYDRRQAEHLRTVVDRLNAEVARLTAALAMFEPRNGERWVTPDMIQYQYEWMEWLAGDQPLVPMDDLRALSALLADLELRLGTTLALKEAEIARAEAAEAALATARRDALEEAAKLVEGERHNPNLRRIASEIRALDKDATVTGGKPK